MNIFGADIDITFILSVWGATLSSALSIMKLVEYWNNRFRIEISSILRGSVGMGHDISINNLSSKPVLLEHMEIFSKEGKDEISIWSPEDSFINARIEPYDNKVFNFNEANYFPWREGVYVRLIFSGKKAIVKSIT